MNPEDVKEAILNISIKSPNAYYLQNDDNCITEEEIGLKHLKLLKPETIQKAAIILADSKDMHHEFNIQNTRSVY